MLRTYLYTCQRPCNTIVYEGKHEKGMYHTHKSLLKCQRMSTVGLHPAYTSSVFSVCLQYAYRINHTSEYAKKILSMLKKIFCLAVCHRMRPCLKRIQPMPNVPLAYVSVFQRMSDIFHTLACASTIRSTVTGPGL